MVKAVLLDLGDTLMEGHEVDENALAKREAERIRPLLHDFGFDGLERLGLAFRPTAGGPSRTQPLLFALSKSAGSGSRS